MTVRKLKGEKRKKLGEPLTGAERMTLVALPRSGEWTRDGVAAALHIHPNTLKYRLACVRAKYGLKSIGIWPLLWEGLQRGDITSVDSERAIGGFVQDVVNHLPTGQGTLLSVALRVWLNGEMARYLEEHRPGFEAAA